jgi:hypothetical protein
MPRLTWQNVDNPNFAGIADSYRTFSELLGKAAESGLAMTDTFTKSKSDAADKAIQLRMLQLQDPAAYQAALANGTLVGPDGANASMAGLKNAAAGETDLLARAGTRELNAQRVIDNTWKNDGNNELVANQDGISAYLAAAAAGDASAVSKLPVNLRADNLTDLVRDGSIAETSALGRKNTRQDMKIQDYGQTRIEKDDKFRDSAAADAEALRQQGYGIDPANDEWIINNQDWDAERKQRALRSASGGGNGASTAIANAAGGGGVTNWTPVAGNSNANAINTAASELGIDPVDLATIISYESGGTFDPSVKGPKTHRGQHIGLIQFGDEEQKKYGAAPGQTFDEQMKAVVAYMKDRGVKPGMSMEDLYSTVNAGSPGRPGAEDGNTRDATVRDKVNGTSMAQHRANASKMFVANDYGKQFPGVNLPTRPDERIPAALRSPETNASNEVAGRVSALVNESLQRQADPSISSLENATTRERISGSQINTLIPQYEKLLGADPQIIDAAKLVADKVGGDPGTISTRIREIMAKGGTGPNKINIATAAAIAQVSARSGEEGADFWGLRDWAKNSFGGEGMGAGTWAIDPNMRDALIKDYTSGATRGQIQNLEREARAQQGVNAADQAVTNLLQTLQRAQAAKEAGRTGMDPLIKRLNEQLERAALQASDQAKALGQIQATEVPVSAAQVHLDQATKGPDPVVSDRVVPRDHVMYLN